jgi:hypothetical protein
MPLYKGEQNIGKNYRKLMEKQATAIAIKVAGRKGGKKKQEKKKRG